MMIDNEMMVALYRSTVLLVFSASPFVFDRTAHKMSLAFDVNQEETCVCIKDS